MNKKPNIVIILADDMGYGDVECYNPKSLTDTPHINRLAEEGTLFTDAHSGCALCSPTRYGIITGTHMWRTEKKHSLYMPYDPSTMPVDSLTIAGMMKKQGYHTACIGKWHLGLDYQAKLGAPGPETTIENHIDFSQPISKGPLDFGFDYFFGSAGCSSSDPPYAYIENRHTVGIPDTLSPEQWNVEPGFYPGLVAPDWKVDEVDQTFTGKAVDYINDRGGKDLESPFFLHFCLNTPHIPWLAPEFIRGTSKEGPRGDMNALVDWVVGQVYDALKKNGLLEDTLLIFTSDNGPQKGSNGHKSAGPLRGFKNSPFEGGHRIPFIARWPGHVETGQTSDRIISLTDLMATFAELGGFEIPNGTALDSMSFLSSLLGEKKQQATHPMVNTTGGYVAEDADFAIRKENWKLIVMCPTEDKTFERFLFNLDEDLGETTNLIDSHPGIVNELEKMLENVKSCGTRDL